MTTGKFTNLLVERMKARLSEHGAVAEFCRATGFSRAGVDKWLRGDASPSVDNLEKIAHALGVQAWELLRPEGAAPTAPDHSIEECYRRVGEAMARGREK